MEKRKRKTKQKIERKTENNNSSTERCTHAHLNLRLVRQTQEVGRSEVEEVGAVRTDGATSHTEREGGKQQTDDAV